MQQCNKIREKNSNDMMGKEKHVIAVLHFTVYRLHFAFDRMQLIRSDVVFGNDYLYTALSKTNTGRKGEIECRKLLR